LYTTVPRAPPDPGPPLCLGLRISPGVARLCAPSARPAARGRPLPARVRSP